MDTAKYTPLPTSSSNDAFLPRPRSFLRRLQVAIVLLFLAGVTAYFFTPSHSHARAPLPAVDVKLVREACQLRFWKRKALPYCERATEDSWIEGAPEEKKAPLEVFQVYTPPRATGSLLLENTTAEGRVVEECSRVLMQHTFGWSYGQPFVGEYSPPVDCTWTNVLFNITMTSKGRQFDRLGHLFLGDIEVWRTSTAEPTQYGIVFSYVKDMTHLTALLREPQKIIFDMGNLVNEVYTGSFNVTLTATFYTPIPLSPPKPADLVLPITAEKSSEGQPSHFRLPYEKALITPSLPKNAIRAVVSIIASGNADEEFWYTNVPTEYTNTFPDGELAGHGPFRELQLLVDGAPAGFVWPFATIFTGGIVPSLWRPIVAPTAFDLPEYEIDITPFLPLLLDGSPHTIEIAIFTFDPTTNNVSRALGSDWLVSGRIHIWYDPEPTWETTGTLHQHQITTPAFSFESALSADIEGRNESLSLSLSAHRSLVIVATLATSSGFKHATWAQGIHYDYTTTLSSGGNIQVVDTCTYGSEHTVGWGSRSYHFAPLKVETAFIPLEKEFNLTAEVTVGLSTRGSGRWTDGVWIGEEGKLVTQLRGKAAWGSGGRGGEGVTGQVWGEVRRIRDADGVGSYGRRVNAVGGVVEGDWEKVNGIGEGGEGEEWKSVLEGGWGV